MDKSFQKKKESNLISQAQGGSGLMGREYLKKRMKEKQVTKIKSILKKADLLSFSYDRERQVTNMRGKYQQTSILQKSQLQMEG